LFCMFNGYLGPGKKGIYWIKLYSQILFS